MGEMIRFEGVIEILGINPYVLVSPELAEEIRGGWRRAMPVRVRVNGEPEEAWGINMMPVGDGSFYLYLAGEVRKASGTGVGDRVEVELEFDEGYQGGPDALPGWFAEALDADAVAAKNWEALTPSRQKEVVRYLSRLKSEEARERNLEKMMRILGGGHERFMARDW